MFHPSTYRPWSAVLACAIALSFGGAAHAEREHRVNRGQTLAAIASRYGVSVSALAGANGMGGDRNAALRPGQVLIVPEPGVVFVSSGQSLASIARAHQVSAVELARANRVGERSALRIGQRLVLPGHEAAVAAKSAEQRWGAARRPGTVVLHRLVPREQLRIRLIDRRGRIPQAALSAMQRLLRPRGSRHGKEPHPRLLRLLAQVSDHFGGRALDVISGNRRPGGYTKETSRHVAAQAIDFRIPGVPLEALRDYCAQLDHVGVGFYPRTRFVHLDVRRTSARWTDRSGPGEAPNLDSAARTVPQADDDAEGEPAAEDDGQAPIDEEPDSAPGK